MPLVFIWLFACLVTFFALGNLPLRDFDEGTVAQVAFELSQKEGLDRFLPTLWDKPYLNKPPGLHWLISAAIELETKLKADTQVLPSEFYIRFFPALFSTFVVPLGGLIQWHLSQKDKLATISTSCILLTLLPVIRHGRLAMLDGTQLSAIALLWFFLVTLNNSKWDKFKCLGVGFSCSYMLLLKAPLLLPALLAGLVPFLVNQNHNFTFKFLHFKWFSFGIAPGFSWHILNALANGKGALWMWWGDGAGRVLFSMGAGSDLGALVPLIEIFEGGWPWILLWPFGLVWAFYQRKTIWGAWVLSTQIIIF